MKILLIWPKSLNESVFADSYFSGDPLALEYVGTGLVQDHDVEIVDMRYEENWEKIVENFAPDIVGITAFTFHVNAVKKVCQRIKTIFPHTLTVVGGRHAIASPKDFYEPYIDVVVKGEGISTFREIVKRTEQKKSMTDLQGASVNVDNTFIENKVKIIDDLNVYPIPDRRLRKKMPSKDWSQSLALLITSQGCPYRCRFCSCWEATGGKYLTRNFDSIIQELKRIEDPFVHFADDESFINPHRMMQLAELIDKEGIQKQYFCYIRADTVIKYPHIVKMWKDVGLTTLTIGMETHKEEDLITYNKNSTIQQNLKAIHILKEIGITVVGTFIIRQDFSEKDFDELAKFANNSLLDVVFFSILTPLPGTQLFYEQKDNLITRNYDLFDFMHTVLPTKLPLKDFYREVYHLNIRTAKMNIKGINQMVSSIPGSTYEQPKDFVQGFNKMKFAYQDHEPIPV